MKEQIPYEDWKLGHLVGRSVLPAGEEFKEPGGFLPPTPEWEKQYWERLTKETYPDD